MSTMPNTNPGIDSELYERRVLDAARHERTNRPRHLLLMSAMLLVVAIGFVYFEWSKRSTAFDQLQVQRNQANLIVETANKLKALEAKAAAEGRPKWGAPIAEIRSKIQQAATVAGLKNANMLPTEQTDQLDRKLGVQRKKLTYREVRDDSLENLLRWVQSTAAEIPGLEVYSIEIHQPEINQWKITVVFSRWERVGG